MEVDVSVIDPKTLRNVCGLFVTGVTVITTEEEGKPTGTTVNSFTSVSLDPPLVLFCLHKDSRLAPALARSRSFGVNFLAGRQERLAWAFAGRDPAALESAVHHTTETGVPVLGEALAFLACRLVNEYDGGDHTIYLGEVAELGGSRHGAEPLVFFRGSMGVLEEQLLGIHPILDG
ncbi:MULTISPECIES: flavin reductase family protein [Actinomadura]|uniref:flavin reductase family protein n=1 Tax=Actinomadura TaxID=1988 RepID=UPI0012E2614F|nr:MULTISPECIES: flavin reductase family protein [Actinomadura]MBT2207987.1 flavin reductase family protein [Actinomadura sp. NEAU-AAG7]